MRPWQVLLLAGLIWLPGLFFRPPDRQQELRVLITARNMVRAGDPLHFEFQNTPRYRKPPMAYWLAAAPMAATGTPQSVWVARMPFFLVSLGGLGLFLRLTRTTGLWPGLLLAFSFGLWAYAPLAETDMLQLAGILAAFLGWQRRSGSLAGFGMAFALLSKGPGGLLIPLLSFAILQFRDPRPLRFWSWVLSIPLACAAAWAGYLWTDPVSREALRRELTATFVDTAHDNPWFYYLYTLPLLLLPGWLFLFLPKRRRNTGRPVPDSLKIPWTWLLVTVVLLTLTVSKQRHYALLPMPPAAWLLGAWLRDRRPLPGLRPLLAAAAALALVSTIGFLRMEESRNARFLRRAASIVPEESLIHVVGVNSAIFDFHLGRHVHNIDSARAALTRARPGDTVAIVQKRESWDANPRREAELQADDDTWIRRLYRISP